MNAAGLYELEIACFHAQAPQSNDARPPAPILPDMEDIILANLAQLQADPNFVESLRFQEAIRHMDASSFFEALQAALVLERFTILHFKFYAGTTEPVMDVQYYQVMSLY